MRLSPDEPRMVRELYDFNQPSVGRYAAHDHSMLLQAVSELIVELIPVPVALTDLWTAVRFG